MAIHGNQLFWRRLRHSHEFNVQQRSIHSTDRHFGHTSVSLQAVSLADKNATATVTINVVIAPSFGTALPPNGANGVPYSFAIPVTGGVAPLTLTIATGSLPAGLTISQSGTISGKPTGSNTSNTFKVQVADNGNPPIKVLSPQYTINISAPPPLSITSSGALLGATVNTAYSTSIVTSGGVPPFTWSKTSGNFPAGADVQHYVRAAQWHAHDGWRIPVHAASDRFSDSGADRNDTSATVNHREVRRALAGHAQCSAWRCCCDAVFDVRASDRRRAALHVERCVWPTARRAELKSGVGRNYWNADFSERHTREFHAGRKGLSNGSCHRLASFQHFDNCGHR